MILKKGIKIMFNKRKKYIAVFLMKEQNTYNIIGRKLFKPTSDSLNYKGNSYIFKVSTPTYSKGLKLFFFLDMESKKQLLFVKNKSDDIDTEVIDLILSKKIIKQLTSELGGIDFKITIFYLIIGLAIGGMIGYIIGSG